MPLIVLHLVLSHRVSNCVGYRNYRYFVSFLFWATLATMYVSGISGALLIRKGSLLFPANGRSPTQILTETFFGGTDNNIYATLYDVLAGSNKTKHTRKREHNHHQRSRDALQETQRLSKLHASDMEEPATVGSVEPASEKRRALEEEYIKIPPAARDEHDAPSADVHTAEDAAAGAAHSTDLRGRRGIPVPSHRKHKSNVSGPLSALGILGIFGTPDLLVFIAFMLSCGVWVGTGSLLCFHIFLSKFRFSAFGPVPCRAASKTPVKVVMFLSQNFTINLLFVLHAVRSGYTTIEFFESDMAAKQCK
jgi:hypothetical protein